jgi:hypothetical protein
VILSNIKSDEIVVEPVVPVTPFSIINGNFALRLVADAYPKGTVFSIILLFNERETSSINWKNKEEGFLFYGGKYRIFTWFFRDFGIEEL